jgi:hypothetical protein
MASLSPKSRKGAACLTLVLVGAFGVAILFTVTAWEKGNSSRRNEHARLDHRTVLPVKNDAVQRTAEVAVMTFQVVGALTLAGIWLAPMGFRHDRQNALMLCTQVALGIAGGICASFDSRFALYAGATIVVLLLGVIFSAGGEASPSTARSPRFA